MSQASAKKIRREMRKRWRDLGMTPENMEKLLSEKVEAEFEERVALVHLSVAADFEDRLRPRPRFCPEWVWARIVRRVIAPPPPAPETKDDEVPEA